MEHLMNPEPEDKAGSDQNESSDRTQTPIKVRHSQITLNNVSNEVWYCNLVELPQQTRDCFGESVGYPILISLHDGYSTNIMGAKLFLSISSEAIALTLHQAVLRKDVKEENASLHKWTASGFPNHLVIDWTGDFSQLLKLGSILGVKIHRGKPPWRMSGAIESFNWQIMRAVKHLPERENQQIGLSLEKLEKLIIHYIIDHYNQQSFSKDLHHTRTERWEAGLVKFPPDVPPERSLDVCLPRSSSRLVYHTGCVRFEGQIYRDEVLASHVGEHVFLRFNPQNITTIFVFQQQGDEDIFLARACILNFQEERLSLEDAKAIRRVKHRELRALEAIKAQTKKAKEFGLSTTRRSRTF
jgi:putative transposase